MNVIEWVGEAGGLNDATFQQYNENTGQLELTCCNYAQPGRRAPPAPKSTGPSEPLTSAAGRPRRTPRGCSPACPSSPGQRAWNSGA
eukprot:10996357-Alexandrium_andersonii.AAC.1